MFDCQGSNSADGGSAWWPTIMAMLTRMSPIRATRLHGSGAVVAAAGEMQTQIDCEKVVQDVFCEIGFDSYVEDVFSVDGKCLSDKTCEAESPGGGRRSAGSQRGVCRAPGIARGVHVGKNDLDVDAEDQGIKFRSVFEVMLKWKLIITDYDAEYLICRI